MLSTAIHKFLPPFAKGGRGGFFPMTDFSGSKSPPAKKGQDGFTLPSVINGVSYSLRLCVFARDKNSKKGLISRRGAETQRRPLKSSVCSDVRYMSRCLTISFIILLTILFLTGCGKKGLPISPSPISSIGNASCQKSVSIR